VAFGGLPIQRLTEQEAVTLVRGCLDRGVNFIDTARAYSVSEEYIGKGIAGRRDQVVLATMTTARDRAGLSRDLETSLRLLGCETIDLYQLHGVSSQSDYERVLGPDGAMQGLYAARQAGKIRHIGISSHSVEVSRQAIASGLFETILFPLNFVARELGEQIYPLAVEHDVGFITMKPLGGGMLSDARLAFKYLMQFEHAVLLTGIERLAELEQILAIVSGSAELSEVEREEMARIRRELGDRFCRRCQYCQPCPHGVSITQLMVAESNWKRCTLQAFLDTYASVVKQAAADCAECGECEDKCPYKLPIRQMLKESIAFYERQEAAQQRSR